MQGTPPRLDPHTSPALGSRFLFNRELRVLVAPAGTGGSWYGKHALSRWLADPVEDPSGFSIYIRDLKSNRYWSASRFPTGIAADRESARWTPGSFVIERKISGIATCLEIAVAPDAPLEMRRLTLTNRGREPRCLDLTSYIEVVLAEPRAFESHPAFSKLFVQTEWLQDDAALLARRRPRARDETHPCLVHALLDREPIGFETSRVHFLGRGRGLASPRVFDADVALSGSSGNVLDPIVSLRCRVDLDPGESRHVTFALGGAADRTDALRILERFRSRAAIEAAFTTARREAQSTLTHLGITLDEAEYDQALAGALLYGEPGLWPQELLQDSPHTGPTETDASRTATGVSERPGLTPQNPYLLLLADASSGASLSARLQKAHRHWREIGLDLDLVVLAGPEALPNAAPPDGLHGGLHVLDTRTTSPEDRRLIAARARAVVTGHLPRLQPDRPPPAAAARARGPRVPQDTAPTSRSAAGTPETLLHFNGFGGFSSDAREYVLHLRGSEGRLEGLPPQAWINVLANESFGTLVSETGAGATWSRNSREHRLTPWCNDPLVDPHVEALYLRDEASHEFWSPLPGPAPADGEYTVRHGFGSSSFEHESHGLLQHTRIFVSRHDPLKITTLRLRNRTDRPRSLSLFAYQQLVLTDLPQNSERKVVTHQEARLQALFARNRSAREETDAVAFAALVPNAATRVRSVSCDRAAFLGVHGTPAAPAALDLPLLDGATGHDRNPCFVQQIHVDLEPREEVTIHLLFGEGRDEPQARQLLEEAFHPGAVEAAWCEVETFWKELLEGVQIETPAPQIDIMVNGWLPYQTLACRLWARSALYQSGGAFGFRDQLQDAASLVTLWPQLSRNQILLHAQHQFVEGDVLHWWHPPASRGIRTRFADDLLWLPYLTAHYIETTGDWSILDESLRFLRARPLAPGEDEAYLLPEDSGSHGDLYEHCCRAIDRSLVRGEHGLPLFGTGDWNDGMNRVGHEGRGESVWMGFFLYSVLGDFLPLCRRRHDRARETLYRQHRESLQAALEESAWDGAWYRRGYYDNGHPLGSRESDECRIDALVQAWAVLSGAAKRERAEDALDAVERHLVSDADGIIRLLTPPFENTPEDPGYIKAYVPGVRENGGQYTHAALWVVRALAELGRNDRVAPLLTRLTPLWHARDAESVATYRVEPYVVAADIYGEPPHVGRGGWTWYTGSSGWMLRVALESLLGLRLVQGETLRLSPCVPDAWPGFRILYRLPGETTRYEIVATNPRGRGLGVFRAHLDGKPANVSKGVARIPVQHDGATHRIDLVLGRSETGES